MKECDANGYEMNLNGFLPWLMNFDKQIKLLAISYDSNPRERPAAKKSQFRNSDFTWNDFFASEWLVVCTQNPFFPCHPIFFRSYLF